MATIAEGLLTLFRDLLAAREDARVREFVGTLDPVMSELALAPHPLASLAQLDRAALIAPEPMRHAAGYLAAHRRSLHWGQTYSAADFGPDFLANYGWVEVFGTRGHFENEAMAGGFLLLGPQTIYPDHHHIAEEIYIPLTGGSEWRKGDGPFLPREAGEVIHHPSNLNHAMRTGAEPLLALYLWRGGPLAQRSVITAAAQEGC